MCVERGMGLARSFMHEMAENGSLSLRGRAGVRGERERPIFEPCYPFTLNVSHNPDGFF